MECKDKCDLRISCEHSIHAEANAIAFAAKVGIALEGSSLYCTTSPCIKCAELIIQSGIIKVFYTTRYRDISGISILEESLVQCIPSDIQYDFYEPIQNDSNPEGDK